MGEADSGRHRLSSFEYGGTGSKVLVRCEMQETTVDAASSIMISPNV